MNFRLFLLIVIFSFLLGFCCGCSPLPPITYSSPFDNGRFEDDFNRATQNPISPEIIIPRSQR